MEEHAEHVTSPFVAFLVFVALLVLMVLTIWAASIEHGTVGLLVALLIATVKAVLIIYYFMNVRFTDVVTRLFVVSAFFWLLLLLVIMMSDFIARFGGERTQEPIAAAAQSE